MLDSLARLNAAPEIHVVSNWFEELRQRIGER